jgi:predicted NodU family carbamoyl transferase
VLVNTSLNRAGEPIVERPEEAVDLFISDPRIDALLVGDWLLARKKPEARG